MKLFWKIFRAVIIAVVIAMAFVAYLISTRQLADAKQALVNEYTILGQLLANELRLGYTEAQLPFDSLNTLASDEGFLFWWVVTETGSIYLADDESFMRTHAYDYFPEVADVNENIYLNDKQSYGIVISPLRVGTEDWSFWLGFSTRALAETRLRVLRVTTVSVFITLLVLGGILYYVVRRFLQPIAALSRGAIEVGEGNLAYEVEVTSHDELGVLANTFNTMTRQLDQLIHDLKGQERLKQEMALAREIQTALLPHHVEHEELDIVMKMLPAESVGGDYYDVIDDGNGNLWIGIGDVSGHGVTPGLIMMMAQTIHMTIITHLDMIPSQVISIVNQALYKNVYERLNENHFMTFTTLKYVGKGKFLYAGAHLELIIYRSATQQWDIVDTSGVWLNLLPDIADLTQDEEIFLDQGDILILYTDGLTELWRGEEILGLEGFLEIVEKHIHGPLETVCDAIITDALAWANNVTDDDMSLVLMQRKA